MSGERERPRIERGDGLPTPPPPRDGTAGPGRPASTGRADVASGCATALLFAALGVLAYVGATVLVLMTPSDTCVDRCATGYQVSIAIGRAAIVVGPLVGVGGAALFGERRLDLAAWPLIGIGVLLAGWLIAAIAGAAIR